MILAALIQVELYDGLSARVALQVGQEMQTGDSPVSSQETKLFDEKISSYIIGIFFVISFLSFDLLLIMMNISCMTIWSAGYAQTLEGIVHFFIPL